MKVILISGKKGTGKSTLVAAISKSVAIKKMSFAEPLKDAVNPMLVKLFGEQALLDENKELMARKIYQAVGMTGRDVDPDFWIKKLKEKIIQHRDSGSNEIIAIDDVRFENELTFLEDVEGLETVYIRMDRESVYPGVDDDPSECGMDYVPDSEFDYLVQDVEDDNTKRMIKEIGGE